MTKICTKCLIEKDVKEFNRRKYSSDGYNQQCRTCINKQREKHKDSNKIRAAKYYKNNKEHLKEQTKEYRDKVKNNINYKKQTAVRNNKYYTLNKNSSEYKQKAKENYKTWSINNRPKKNAAYRKYIHNRDKRTPKWLDEEDFEIMQWAYETAKEREMQYGIKFHVDHIIPLNGKNVSGFHCPENLQVIPAYENLSKSNKF